MLRQKPEASKAIHIRLQGIGASYLIRSTHTMQVEKRDGSRVPVEFDKITQRIKPLCENLTSSIDPVQIAQKVIEGVHDGVKTSAGLKCNIRSTRITVPSCFCIGLVLGCIDADLCK